MRELPNDLLIALERAPYPIFATDQNHRIIAWNGAMERWIGHGADEAVGEECFALMTGTDVYGNHFCTRDCNVMKMIRRSVPVNRYDLDLKCASGERVRAHCAVLVLPGPAPSQFTILHLLEEVESAGPGRGKARKRDGPRPVPLPKEAGVRLTPREQQVLRMLAGGAGTVEISQALFISAATVRTHVRNILEKTGAHTRLEAVLQAIRHHLV